MASENERGFTLVELTVVVAIVGLLAAIAIPAYQIQVARAQVAEGLQLAEGVRMAVSAHYAETGVVPRSHASAGIAGSTAIRGKYVTAIEIFPVDFFPEWRATLLITFGGQASPALQGKVLSLHAYESNTHNLIWACETRWTHTNAIRGTNSWMTANVSQVAKINQAYLPAECR